MIRRRGEKLNSSVNDISVWILINKVGQKDILQNKGFNDFDDNSYLLVYSWFYWMKDKIIMINVISLYDIRDPRKGKYTLSRNVHLKHVSFRNDINGL